MALQKQVVLVASCVVLCFSGLAGTLRQGRAAVYVVDSAAPGAADANPGTEEKPFKTVQHAADVAKPGDTFYVMAGRYNERISVKTSGAEGRPIAFQAMPRHTASVGGFDLDASFIRVQGFEITADKPATAVQLRGSHCDVLDNDIHDMMEGVAGSGGSRPSASAKRDYSAVAHNRIAYNKVYHSEYGFLLNGEDWLVENNEVNRLFMYAAGNTYDDCDYTRFFGKGCVERCNYYHGSSQQEIKTAHVDCVQTFPGNGDTRGGPALRRQRLLRLPPDVHGGEAGPERRPAGLDLSPQHRLHQFADDARRLGPGHHPDARRDDREQHHRDRELVHNRPAGQALNQRPDPQQHPLRRGAGRRQRRRDLLARQAADGIQLDVQDGAARGRDKHQ